MTQQIYMFIPPSAISLSLSHHPRSDKDCSGLLVPQGLQAYP